MTLYSKIDVSLARDPRMIAAGPMARLLYIQAILYCRENLTDGHIDRLILPLVAVDIPKPSNLMDRLVEVGAIELNGVGWQIPETVWRKYNPTKAEVEQMRQDAADRKRDYRERKRNGDVPMGQEEVSRWDMRAAL
jgi:hypothetical protein